MTERTHLQDDIEAVSRIRSGDATAFEGLVERYFGTVRAIAYARLGDHDAADDLAQEVFLHAYLQIDTLRDVAALPAWLISIARNKSANWLRSDIRRSHALSLVPLEEEIMDSRESHSLSPREQAAKSEEHRRLHDAVMRLPEELRELVLLHYGEELSQTEIALRLGVHPSTVCRQLQQALETLRAAFEEDLRAAVKPSAGSSAARHRTIAVVAAAAALAPEARGALAAALSSAAPETIAAKNGFMAALLGGKKAALASAVAVFAVVGAAVYMGANRHSNDSHLSGKSTLVASDNSASKEHPKSSRSAASDPPSGLLSGSASANFSGSTGPHELGDEESNNYLDQDDDTTRAVLLKVVNEEGQPVAAAEIGSVALRSTNQDGRDWVWPEKQLVTTDEAGQAAIIYPTVLDEGVRTGELRIALTHPDYVSLYRHTISTGVKESTIVLTREQGEQAEVTFHVVDETSTPVAGARLHSRYVRMKGSEESGSSSWPGPKNLGFTDSSGKITVRYPKQVGGMEITILAFNVQHPQFVEEDFQRRIDESPEPVVLEKGANVTLSGYIGHEENRIRGIKAATYQWNQDDHWTALDEHVLINARTKAGLQIVSATHMDAQGVTYLSDPVIFHISKGESKSFHVALKPTLRLAGVLSDNVPRPVINGSVMLNVPVVTTDLDGCKTGQHRFFSAVINPDGTFEFTGLPVGRAEIIALANGWYSRHAEAGPDRRRTGKMAGLPQQFDLAADGQEFVLEMEPTATFKATIIRETGEPISGATVSFSPNVFWDPNIAESYVRPNFFSKSDDAGMAIIPDIPAGEVFCGVRHDEFEVPEGAVYFSRNLKPGETLEEIITMRRKD